MMTTPTKMNTVGRSVNIARSIINKAHEAIHSERFRKAFEQFIHPFELLTKPKSRSKHSQF